MSKVQQIITDPATAVEVEKLWLDAICHDRSSAIVERHAHSTTVWRYGRPMAWTILQPDRVEQKRTILTLISI